jgi:hypothetical protein
MWRDKLTLQEKLEHVKAMFHRTRMPNVATANLGPVTDEEIEWFKKKGIIVTRQPFGYVKFEKKETR